MKRTLSGLVILCFIMFVTACEPSEVSEEDFALFTLAVQQYDILDSAGFNYESVQKVDEWVTNADYIETRIDTRDELKIYLEHRSLELQHFDPDFEHMENVVVYYYHDQRIGEEINEGQTHWEEGDHTTLLETQQPIKRIEPNDFITYEIVRNKDVYVLTGDIKEDVVARVIDLEHDDLLKVSITITLDNQRIAEISVFCQLELSTIDIVFKPFYGIGEVVLPTES